MKLPPLRLREYELGILIVTIDAYRLTLAFPDIYPEHMSIPILEDLKIFFWTVIQTKKEPLLCLAEEEVNALLETTRGFMRICQREPNPSQLIIQEMLRYQGLLTQVKYSV